MAGAETTKCDTAVVSMTGAETTKCDTAAQLRFSSHFQGQRSNDMSGRVISLQGLDLNQASNETAERLIDALNDGAQFDKESLVGYPLQPRRSL
jgi:hypothetical protein